MSPMGANWHELLCIKSKSTDQKVHLRSQRANNQ
jgi:hypothetical protein